ncbi:MAG TPA: ABC transporter substrate-binding protein [Bryobacteraceae bacterium]|jgi:peptide/nickel transport system substrate-binding protein
MRWEPGLAVCFGAIFFAGDLPCLKAVCPGSHQSSTSDEPDYLEVTGQTGERGGTLILSERSEAKTFNPLIAIDGTSRETIALMMADLIHINRYTQQSEPALAKSWAISQDGRRYTLHLRRGLRFSDGHPFDADDVVFTFRAYLDQRIHAPQRDFLIVGGRPISVQKLDAYTVLFNLAEPYAAAERLFDSIAILPRHLLEAAYEDGTLGSAWGLNVAPDQIAGLGPFRLKQYVPGQKIVLERNPFFWKRDGKRNVLPYLHEIVCLSDISSEAETIRFEAGETDIVSRIGAENFAILNKDEGRRRFRMYDAGPGLEYTFLAFNLNDLVQGREPSITEKQKWFRQTAFRQAISNTIDRGAIVRLAYAGRAYPLLVPVSPGNRLWFDPAIPRPLRSVERAKRLLREAGFSWSADGSLNDVRGRRVEFSIMHNARRAQHVQMATIIQQDLKDIGIKVNLIPLDFATLVDRVFNSFVYEAAIVTLADGDSDPNSQMSILLSHGAAHAWKLRSNSSPDEWQQEIDRLMEAQMTTIDHSIRKQMFDRVQQLVWQHEPVIFLVSPDILAGASDRVGNFQPAVLSSYTLWNADQLFIRGEQSVAPR